jgi:hypothetical protein
MLEREVLPVLRANEHMGPDTELSEAKLELRDDALRFELELSGVNTLAVSGVILVAVVDERRLFAKLTLLSEVDFRGKLRNQARGIGAGGGALVGGLILGPLAPVGAVAGWFLADKVVTRKASDLIHEQIEAGLAKLDDVDLLPTHVELIPGQPGSRARQSTPTSRAASTRRRPRSGCRCDCSRAGTLVGEAARRHSVAESCGELGQNQALERKS